MKKVWQLFTLLILVLMFSSCGYHNPNVYEGPAKTIYITNWPNRTSELSLSSDIYRSLTRWFQKAGSIKTVRQKAEADLILAGEIISLELPSLSSGADSLTTEGKVKLTVRYILKEITTNTIILEKSSELWTETYLVSTSYNTTLDNERDALDVIIEDLSKKIYQRTVTKLPKL